MRKAETTSIRAAVEWKPTEKRPRKRPRRRRIRWDKKRFRNIGNDELAK